MVFRDHRTGERRAHQVHAFINGVCFNSGPNVIAYKLFTQIFDVEFRRASLVGLVLEAAQLLTLSHVGAITNNLAAIVLFEPAKHH